ncbi:MAG: hypothetical protein ACTHK4_08160, partial [Mycobacteriales bacterium]
MRIRSLAARTPLRVKLVATVLALAAAGLSVAAVAATAALHSYLIGRVDDQLRVAAHGIADGDRFGPGPGGGGPVPPPGGYVRPDDANRGGRLPSPYVVR